MAADPADSDATAPAIAAALDRERAGFRTVAPGDRLGRYEVLEAIGEGGMATVFRARDPELRREVAIKVLFPHLSRRREVVQRFQREARAAARLRHPTILQTYDVGGGEGSEPPYIVMELVHGTSLDEHVAARGPLLAELVACAGVVVAEALAVAHQAGVIHRDLKPANLLVCDDGRLLLADFGVARVDRDESLATRTGAVLGTPAYMSPEQATGDEVDVRSDVYSLGATLYHLATGGAPYSGTAMKVMSQLATPGALVPPMKRRPAVGRALSSVIVELMANQVAARPAGAKEAGAKLRPVMKGLAGGEGDDGASEAGAPSDELAAYFKDPEAYLASATRRVVASLVTEGGRARREGKMAAAMAAADRASALAPDDEAVHALIKDVTSQQTTGRRWKVAAMVGAPVMVLAVGAVVLWGRGIEGRSVEEDARGADAAAAVDSSMVAAVGGAGAGAERSSDPGTGSGSGSSSGSDSNSGSGTGSKSGSGSGSGTGSKSGSGSGSGTGTRSGSGLKSGSSSGSGTGTRSGSGTRSDLPSGSGSELQASPNSSSSDASAPTAPTIVEEAKQPAPASVTFAMDAWCELSIDGKPQGRADRNRAIALPAGKHVAECTQGAGLGSWREELQLAEGEARKVSGELRMEVAVTVEVSGATITLDGKAHKNRDQLTLRNGRHHVTVRGASGETANGWVSVPRVARCTLRDQPVLDCYP